MSAKATAPLSDADELNLIVESWLDKKNNSEIIFDVQGKDLLNDVDRFKNQTSIAKFLAESLRAAMRAGEAKYYPKNTIKIVWLIDEQTTAQAKQRQGLRVGRTSVDLWVVELIR